MKSKPYKVGGEYVTKDEYNKSKFDSFLVRVGKGKKQAIEDVARSQGESINGYVKKAVRQQIKQDTGNDIEL